MPRTYRVVPDDREPMERWAQHYGEPPYWNIEMDWGGGDFEVVAMFGREQMAVLHAELGAILAKNAHAQAPR